MVGSGIESQAIGVEFTSWLPTGFGVVLLGFFCCVAERTRWSSVRVSEKQQQQGQQFLSREKKVVRLLGSPRVHFLYFALVHFC